MPERPEAVPRAEVLGRDDGLALHARGGTLLFKATGAGTNGGFSLMDRVVPAGGRAPQPHVHPDCTEAFFLREGSLRFLLDGEPVDVDVDGFVLVPGGVAHTFANVGTEPARVLIIHSPALDGYFKDLHDLWLAPEPPTAAQERELMLRHGLVPVDADG